jgi:hypothetical protein
MGNDATLQYNMPLLAWSRNSSATSKTLWTMRAARSLMLLAKVPHIGLNAMQCGLCLHRTARVACSKRDNTCAFEVLSLQ